MENALIKHGDFAQDKITGFKGIVMAKHIPLFGPTEYLIQPRELKDGKPIDQEWFPAERVKLLDSNPVEV